MSLQNLNHAGGDVSVNAIISDHNVYSYVLTATVDAQTVTSIFGIFIKDPCSTASFRIAASPVVDMTVFILSDAIQTPILTDL